MKYVELDTPALLLDQDVLEANIAAMADFFRGRAANLRAHVKTHKCPGIALMQIDAGAVGVCCQKLGEAEVMCAAGIGDILVTNQVVGTRKIERLLRLPREADVKVAVDSAENVESLGSAGKQAGREIPVVIELDLGMGRSGVRPGQPAVELARVVEGTDGVTLAGLMGFEGHCVDVPDPTQRRMETERANALLVDTADLVRQAGVGVRIVSAGGTGTYNMTGSRSGITEVEAGSYVFMDTSYRDVLQDFDVALTVLGTVTSRPAANRVTLDCGSKTLAGDFGTPAIMDLPGCMDCQLSEEHASFTYPEPLSGVRVGDKLRVIPAHCCSTVNLHDEYNVLSGEDVVGAWRISAARKTQ